MEEQTASQVQTAPSLTGRAGGEPFIGQQAIWQRLLADLKADRVPHALMFCGPAGAGKLALAVAFAQTLLCQHPNEDGSACGECTSCKMAAKLEHPDLHFTFPFVKGTRIKTPEAAISDVYIKEWRARVLQSPYFDLNDWLPISRPLTTSLRPTTFSGSSR